VKLRRKCDIEGEVMLHWFRDETGEVVELRCRVEIGGEAVELRGRLTMDVKRWNIGVGVTMELKRWGLGVGDGRYPEEGSTKCD